MPVIRSQIVHNSGIILGGLGTGSVEVRPDGYFHEWQIFNTGIWAPRQPECCSAPAPEVTPEGIQFFVRAQKKGAAPVVRRLGMRTEINNIYSLAWAKSVESIDFDGRYPVAKLSYNDRELPVSVESRIFSPFVPHNQRISGTPGFYAVFTLKNRTSAVTEVSLAASLQNHLAVGAEDRKLSNVVKRTGNSVFLDMNTSADRDCNSNVGSMGMSCTGGQLSWISGDYRQYLAGYVKKVPDSPYGLVHECYLHGFREKGELSCSTASSPLDWSRKLKAVTLKKLSFSRKKILLKEALRHAFASNIWRRITKVNGRPPRTEDEITAFLTEILGKLNYFAGVEGRDQTWGDAALCSKIRLRPGETKEIVFTFGWHFPNHYSKTGKILGHMYERWFKDAGSVNRFLVSGYADIENRTTAFVPGSCSNSGIRSRKFEPPTGSPPILMHVLCPIP